MKYPVSISKAGSRTEGRLGSGIAALRGPSRGEEECAVLQSVRQQHGDGSL